MRTCSWSAMKISQLIIITCFAYVLGITSASAAVYVNDENSIVYSSPQLLFKVSQGGVVPEGSGLRCWGQKHNVCDDIKGDQGRWLCRWNKYEHFCEVRESGRY
jgi:hypothetical protein